MFNYNFYSPVNVEIFCDNSREKAIKEQMQLRKTLQLRCRVKLESLYYAKRPDAARCIHE